MRRRFPKPTLLRLGMVLCLAVALSLDPQAGHCDDIAEDPGGAAVPEEVLSPGEKEHDVFEQTQEEWSRTIVSTATWMDTFFDDERFSSTSNQTYLRVRVSPIVDHNGYHTDSYVDLRLLLPKTERWLLTMGGDPEREAQFGSTPMEDSERATSGRDDSGGYIGVSTFFKRTRTRNVGLGGGFKFRSSGIVTYGTFKWVELWEFNRFDLRGMQRFRIYSDEGAEAKTQLDLEWPIAHRFFFRTTGSALFKKSDPNSFYDLDLTLYQYLTTKRAILYKIRNGYIDKPERSTYLSRVIGEITYRQQWRKWFSTSLTPQLAMYDTRDWHVDPGIRLDFNLRLGYQDERGFESAYTRKQENLKIKAREDREKALRESHERFLKMQQEQP